MNRKRLRLKNYDYSSSGYYYITICTHNRRNFFGKVSGSEMNLSFIGKIVETNWYLTAKIRSNVFLDEFIVMPNHFHGIIVIRDVGTPCKVSLQGTSDPIHQNQFGPQRNNLSTIIGSFKASCTRQIYQSNIISRGELIWQNRFYEHVIRTQEALNSIREYIRNNPLTWSDDLENQKYAKQLTEKKIEIENNFLKRKLFITKGTPIK